MLEWKMLKHCQIHGVEWSIKIKHNRLLEVMLRILVVLLEDYLSLVNLSLNLAR
jgi:hypothetical protein